MRNYLLSALLLIIISSCTSTDSKKTIVNNDEIYIDSLISVMTPEEKAGQLTLEPVWGYYDNADSISSLIEQGLIGSFLKANGCKLNLKLQKIAVEKSRLGIPLMFHEDVIHGYRTICPIPLAEAASWDMEAVKATGALAAKEAAAAGVHLTYAPMVDVTREPRWGRVMETAGEDSYLGCLVAAAKVKGFQGENLKENNTIMACAKHFAGYGSIMAGRDYNINDFSERELRETHLPSFQAAIDAGVGSIMCAYSAYNGEPITASKFIMQDVLRDEMGFAGMLISDWKTIENLRWSGVVENDTIGAIKGLNTGIDNDMSSSIFMKILPELIKQRKVDEKVVNAAVKRVLMAKAELGLFDDPYAYFDTIREAEVLLADENKEIARDAARKSFVLLKNENEVLPLAKDISTIALIGPMKDAKRDLLGWWEGLGKEEEVVSMAAGIKAAISDNTTLLEAEGCKIDSFKLSGKELIAEAVAVAKKSDVVILSVGELYWMSGEAAGKGELHLPSYQEELVKAIKATGKPVITVVMSGRPNILTDIASNSDALLHTWYSGTMGGHAIADVLFGDYSPSGKLPITFPIHEGQVPIFYSYRRTSHSFHWEGRYTARHIDLPHEPLYEFGYGLSYADFEYSEIELSDSTFNRDGKITASVNVKNIGEYEGREVVQLYIADLVCSVTRPEKELKGFELVNLKSGESKQVNFEISVDDLYFINADFKKVYEPGKFDLFIGRSSAVDTKVNFYLTN